MAGKTKRIFRVGVFVAPGKRGWIFTAYTRVYNPEWEGCNVVEVEAYNGKEAKALAIQSVKNRMDLKSKIPPTGIRVSSR